MTQSALLFSFPPFQSLSKELLKNCDLLEGFFALEHFQNQEIHISLQQPVANAHCFVLGSISPPESNLFAYLALCHTLKKEKAKKITALLPYLAYTRHEKEEALQSQLSKLVGSLLEASGVDEILTFDLHTPSIQSLFPMPINSISPATFFAKELRKLSLTDVTFVSPDKGAIQRCEEVARQLDRMPITWIQKSRREKGVFHLEIIGSLTSQAVIIDDILDTGKTLLSCCKMIHDKGVKEIIIMVTHGLFAGDEWKKLWQLGVKKIYCTDTIPLSKEIVHDHKITIIPMSQQELQIILLTLIKKHANDSLKH